jgi:2'-5' RNA ligase
MRYLIAVPLPQEQADLLRHLYHQTYRKPLTIKFLHLTLIPPFLFTSAPHLPEVPTLDNSFHFAPAAVFTQYQRRILYLPVLPPEPLRAIHNQLARILKNQIILDTKPYTNQEVPAFLPHITLDYKFTADPADFSPPQAAITLPAPELFQEHGPGLWKKVS